MGDVTLVEAIAAAVVGSPTILDPWLPPPDLHICGVTPIPEHYVDLDFVRATTAELRELDQRRGGVGVADSAARLLRSLAELTARHSGRAAENSVLVAAADLARLIGWACYDIGDQHRARQYATMALVYARRAGVDSLVASILYVLGRISLIEHDPRTALRMFQLGQLPAQDAVDGGESARLYANEAWAHAMMGDETRMRVALARAEEEIASVGDVIAPWTRVFLTPGEYLGIRSVIFNEYAKTARGRSAEQYAQAAFEGAQLSLSTAAPRPARSILFDNITLATSAFRLGAIDAALSVAATAVQMTNDVTTIRVSDRLNHMAHCAALSSPRTDVKDMCNDVQTTLRAISHRLHEQNRDRPTTA